MDQPTSNTEDKTTRFIDRKGQEENLRAGFRTVADELPHTEKDQEYRSFLACFEA